MNEKLNQRINAFIDTINPKWTKDLKIRYIYRGLASFFHRDLNYFFADYESQLEQFQNGFQMKDENVVSSSICSYYKRVFKRIGIESKIIRVTSTEIPHFSMVVHGDVGWYYLDPLLDLMVNQVGMITSYFAHTPYQKDNFVRNNYPFLKELDFNYIKSLDAQLGLIQYGGYLDDYFDLIDQELNDKKKEKYISESNLTYVENRMKFASDHLINIGKNLSLFERKLYYERLVNVLFRKKEHSSVKVKFHFNHDGLCILILKRLRDEPSNGMVFIEEKNGDNYYLRRTI